MWTQLRNEMEKHPLLLHKCFWYFMFSGNTPKMISNFSVTPVLSSLGEYPLYPFV